MDDDLDVLFFQWAAYSRARLSTKPERWNGGLYSNCLPLSLAALGLVRAKFPQARIVVGNIGLGGVQSNADALIDFLMLRASKPDFHAWIDWRTGWLDLVGPSWLERLDCRLGDHKFFSKRHVPPNVKYHLGLADEANVKEFYRLLCQARGLGPDWDGDCFRR